MKNRYLRTCLIFFILLGGSVELVAQNSYQTDLLVRMANSMQLTSKLNTLQDGVYWKDFLYQNKPITVIVRNHQVEHIGYALFTPYQRSAISPAVFNFLERYSLEVDLPLNRGKTVVRQIAEDGISFEKGTFSFFQILLKDTTFVVNVHNDNSRRYTVSWYKNDVMHCAVNFPADFDLLNGSEMLENERRIAADIRNAPLTEIIPMRVSREELHPTWQNNYFILLGESYYTDQLTANRYYELDNEGQFRLIYHSRYPLESLANLLTTCEIANQYVIDIRLKKYGYKEERISVPLNRWTNYCLRNGCKPFFGVISYDNDLAVCQLIMRNMEQGYNHVMKLTFAVSQLEEKKGTVQARLNGYVPTSKIEYLFDEIKQ